MIAPAFPMPVCVSSFAHTGFALPARSALAARKNKKTENFREGEDKEDFFQYNDSSMIVLETAQHITSYHRRRERK